MRHTSLPRAVGLFPLPYALSPEYILLSFFRIVYRPALRAKSDADIIRDARREALGLPPAHEGDERQRGPRMATDEQVMERFKKRMRK